MTTIHQYLNTYPILQESLKLILGTIHPHDHSVFRLPFFYGNKNSIWAILAKAFPEKFSRNPSLQEVLNFLTDNKIAISDTIEECGRKKLTALDSDLIDIKFNNKLFSQIQNAKITEILFTSGLSKNNACKLFIEELVNQKRITKAAKSKLLNCLKNSKEAI